ncbi:hypothetical protein BDV26DRAFT_298145 [Aspergillus bertholletiae]|uniref:Fumarylacetoacetase-like C-terminal domain-containing protein n=1 Tax=Aspergillus bertholletiae TaxID=1226010 RepID=A0A5N7AQI9_9EURO|nr:hypothetical protein BDV26DRAFT_298145 [Aspergillus bertholletiae]
MSTSWTRLVRYKAAENGPVRFGEPIITDDNEDITSLAIDNRLQVRVCEGNDPFSLQVTSSTETVFQLLGPLEPKHVPIIRCIGLNYKSHIIETGRALPTNPTVFTKPSPAVADHNVPIPIPKIAQSQCDYEGELVIVIGREGKDIPESEALDYVAGYTVGNDVSSRDWQREASKAGPVPQWSFSKSFDQYAPVGPCLVSPSILGEAGGLALQTIINGEVRQSGSTDDLWFGVRRLITFCSQGQTLQRGSLIMTGTPGGVGLFMKPPSFLKHGDEVCVRIEKIGTLRNTIKYL